MTVRCESRDDEGCRCNTEAEAEVAPSHYGAHLWEACPAHAIEARRDGCTVTFFTAEDDPDADGGEN